MVSVLTTVATKQSRFSATDKHVDTRTCIQRTCKTHSTRRRTQLACPIVTTPTSAASYFRFIDANMTMTAGTTCMHMCRAASNFGTVTLGMTVLSTVWLYRHPRD